MKPPSADHRNAIFQIHSRHRKKSVTAPGGGQIPGVRTYTEATETNLTSPEVSCYVFFISKSDLCSFALYSPASAGLFRQGNWKGIISSLLDTAPPPPPTHLVLTSTAPRLTDTCLRQPPRCNNYTVATKIFQKLCQ